MLIQKWHKLSGIRHATLYRECTLHRGIKSHPSRNLYEMYGHILHTVYLRMSHTRTHVNVYIACMHTYKTLTYCKHSNYSDTRKRLKLNLSKKIKTYWLHIRAN